MWCDNKCYMVSEVDMNYKKIADEVYSLGESNHQLALQVKEALLVIDQCLDTHGWVR